MSVSNIFINTNNPGNIRYSKNNNWLGQVGEYKGFCKFVDQIYGLRALLLLLCLNIRNGRDTISSIINRFAPPTENDTKSYIRFIEDEFLGEGFNPQSAFDVKSRQFFILAKTICFYESGFRLTQEEFNYVCNRFSIQYARI